MKLKKIFLFVITIILTFIIFVSVTSLTNNILFNSRSGLLRDINTEKNIKNAWKDIKKSFDIDDSNFYLVSFEDENLFMTNSFEDLKDLKKSKSISNILSEFHENFNKRDLKATMPRIFVKKDYTEILFAYKETNGMNTIMIAKYENSIWNKYEKRKQGAKNLDLSTYPKEKITH